MTRRLEAAVIAFATTLILCPQTSQAADDDAVIRQIISKADKHYQRLGNYTTAFKAQSTTFNTTVLEVEQQRQLEEMIAAHPDMPQNIRQQLRSQPNETASTQDLDILEGTFWEADGIKAARYTSGAGEFAVVTDGITSARGTVSESGIIDVVRVEAQYLLTVESIGLRRWMCYMGTPFASLLSAGPDPNGVPVQIRSLQVRQDPPESGPTVRIQVERTVGQVEERLNLVLDSERGYAPIEISTYGPENEHPSIGIPGRSVTHITLSEAASNLWLPSHVHTEIFVGPHENDERLTNVVIDYSDMRESAEIPSELLAMLQQ